jgi:hypothetical protein
MDFRLLLRPGALFVGSLFVAVAVVDFIDSVRTEPEPLPRLIEEDRLEFNPTAGEAEPGSRTATAALEVDVATESVVITRSGSLVLPFVMDDRVDALIFDYRFTGEGGTATVALARARPGETGVTIGVEEHLRSDARREGRVRFPLHGHEGDYVFSVDADLAAPSGSLLLASVRLIEEN